MSTRTTPGTVAGEGQDTSAPEEGKKEHPILFSGPLVRAILEGRKSQTRRLSRAWLRVKKGDRLWVRETWGPGGMIKPGDPVSYAADWPDAEVIRKWRPSIHMRRADSRIDLEATADAREERLHDITEEDARAEGVQPFFQRFSSIGRDQRITTGELAADAEHRASFAVLWDEINGDKVLWKDNPLVVVLTFKVIRPELRRDER